MCFYCYALDQPGQLLLKHLRLILCIIKIHNKILKLVAAKMWSLQRSEIPAYNYHLSKSTDGL